MAGSYNHATTDAGNLREPKSFRGMIENLGDAYEMAEEMYGMIWYLAVQLGEDVVAEVDDAQRNYQQGLEIAKRVNGESR